MVGLRAAMMLALAGSAVIGACTGDTLYDTDAVPPPDIDIVSPRLGDEFVVGEAIEVQVQAADTLGIRGIEVTYTFMAEADTMADTIPVTFDASLEDVDETVSIDARDEAGELELRAAATNALEAIGISLPVTVQVRDPEETVF